MKDREAERIRKLYDDHEWRCFVCGKCVSQRAHIIANTKSNKSKYGKTVIDNPLNWVPVCSLECNALCDVGHSSNLPNRIAHLIEQGHRAVILGEVRENIARKLNKHADID